MRLALSVTNLINQSNCLASSKHPYWSFIAGTSIAFFFTWIMFTSETSTWIFRNYCHDVLKNLSKKFIGIQVNFQTRSLIVFNGSRQNGLFLHLSPVMIRIFVDLQKKDFLCICWDSGLPRKVTFCLKILITIITAVIYRLLIMY